MAWWIFQSLVTTAALAALVAVVCRFGRIGPVARHALWVLVLVKFVMPPLVVWPWAAPDPLGLAAIEQPGPKDRPPVVLPEPLVESQPGVDDRGARGLKPRPTFGTEAEPRTSRLASVSAWTLFSFVWFAGTICLASIEVVRQIRLASRVRNAGPAEPAIARRVEELATELGVPPVPVIAMEGSSSPAVWCLGRPRLLWPADLQTDSQACIDGVIVHELAHIKRRDHVVGWIELVAGLAWWWNPLFWSVRRAVREQAELACDAWVISALPDGRRAYAESLLALSSPGAPRPPAVAAVMGVRASSRRALERRLVMIMNGRASLRLPWAGFLTLALLAAATLPAWATGNPQQPTPPVVIQKVEPSQTKLAVPVVTSEQDKAKAKPDDQKKYVLIQKPDPKEVRTITVKPTVKQSKDLTVFQEFKKPNPVEFMFASKTGPLPEEGKKLVSDYETDVDAIRKEIDDKLEARRQEAIRKLQALQDQYTKAGKLDEAVAIRDYLRAGGPGHDLWSNVKWIKR